jgi:TRAP-type C4-dicarboxylate transport system permease small subunit
MNVIKVIALALIIAGALALAYGGFTYTQETHDVKLGPLEFSVKEKKQVNIPVWAGIGAIVAGGLLLVMGGKKS